jgi:hypothetical protein
MEPTTLVDPLKRWYVVTPEYGIVIPVLDFGQGPIEYGRDVIEVEAANARDAVALGVKEMLRHRYGVPALQDKYEWCKMAQGDGSNPFAGVFAQPAGESL